MEYLKNCINPFSREKKIKKQLGWKQEPFDERDKPLTFSALKAEELPPLVDLRHGFGSVYDQGSLGSCTANAICSAFEYNQRRQGLDAFEPSRLFVYYNERKMEGTINQDAGAYIRDGMKTINKEGVASEKFFPYVNVMRTFKKAPTVQANKDGLYHRSVRYSRVNHRNLNEIKTALSKGHPITFGFLVFQSFYSNAWNIKTEVMPSPSGNRLGGHAVLLVGYDDSKQAFIVRNSWGTRWGNNGHFMMSYKFTTSSNCSDFWVLETIVDSEPVPVPVIVPVPIVNPTPVPIVNPEPVPEPTPIVNPTPVPIVNPTPVPIVNPEPEPEPESNKVKELKEKVLIEVINLRNKFPSNFTRINRGIDEFEIDLAELYKQF